MDNLQASTRRKFLSLLPAFFWLILSPNQSVSGQNRKDHLSPKSEVLAEAQNTHINFELPFKQCWNFPSSNILSVASDNESSLFVALLGGKTISLTFPFGEKQFEKQWESDLGGEITSQIQVEEKDIYIITRPVSEINTANNDGQVESEVTKNLIIRSINKDTGLTNWLNKIPSQYLSQPEFEFLYVSKSNLFLLNNNGKITALDRSTGQILWEKKNKLILSAEPLFVGDKVIFYTLERQIVVISLSDGSVFRTIALPDNPTAFYYYNENKKLILGNQKGVTYSLNLDFSISGKSALQKKREWEFRNGARVSGINLTPQGLLVSSLDNFVYLISKNSGNLIWKKRLAGRISPEPLITDNYAVITTVNEPSASILDLSTGKLINKITLADENFFLGSPLRLGNKLILTSQKGIFVFSSSDCFKD